MNETHRTSSDPLTHTAIVSKSTARKHDQLTRINGRLSALGSAELAWVMTEAGEQFAGAVADHDFEGAPAPCMVDFLENALDLVFDRDYRNSIFHTPR